MGSRVRSIVVGVVSFASGAGVVLALQANPAGAQSPSPSKDRFWKEGNPPAATKEAPSTSTAPANTLPSLSGLIKTVSPSVVYIFTTKTVRNPHANLPFELGPFGFRGPDDNGDGTFSSRSLGSGFIITSDGYIVTNNHVVADTDEIKVQLSDGREFTAKIAGRDPQIDIALIKIEGKDLPVVTLGDSDKLEQGDWVVAMGNPLGLDHSASVGIVSGLARNIGIGRYDALLQTDAAINPGNSGGPLFNLKGEVVGVNTAIVGGANNIGFAVPVNMAKEVLPDLKAHGKAIRGQLGVLLRPITNDHREALGLKSTDGALIERVVPDSPADRAGLRPGDVIVRYEGTAVKEVKQLQRLVAASRPGSEVKLTYVRGGKEQDARAKLIEFKEDMTVARRDDRPDDGGDGKLGMTVSEITPDLASRYSIRNPDGVIVRRVLRGSPAAEADLQEGDVIREVNRKRVTSPEEFRKEVQAGAGKPLAIVIERDGATEFRVLSPRKTSSR